MITIQGFTVFHVIFVHHLDSAIVVFADFDIGVYNSCDTVAVEFDIQCPRLTFNGHSGASILNCCMGYTKPTSASNTTVHCLDLNLTLSIFHFSRVKYFKQAMLLI